MQQSQTFQERSVILNTLEVNYKIVGQGPAILILHGWGRGSDSYTEVMEGIAKEGYQVVVPDLPGFGKSLPPSFVWGVDEYVEFVKNFADALALQKFVLLGHSFGGSVATKFTIKYPEQVRKLLLVDSAAIRRKRLKKEIQKAVVHFLHQFSFLPFYGFIRKIAYRTLFRSSDYSLMEGVMKETYLKVIGENISHMFSQISVPTLLVWGEKDGITPLAHAYFMKENIPGATLEIIPNVRHNPHREAPETLVKKILEFIQ